MKTPKLFRNADVLMRDESGAVWLSNGYWVARADYYDPRCTSPEAARALYPKLRDYDRPVSSVADEAARATDDVAITPVRFVGRVVAAADRFSLVWLRNPGLPKVHAWVQEAFAELVGHDTVKASGPTTVLRVIDCDGRDVAYLMPVTPPDGLMLAEQLRQSHEHEEAA